MFEKAFGALETYVNDMLTEICTYILSFVSIVGTDLWDSTIVSEFLGLISWVGVGVVGASTVMVIFDVVEESGKSRQIEFSTIFGNFIKGFGFAIIAPYTGKYILILANQLMILLNMNAAVDGLGTTLLGESSDTMTTTFTTLTVMIVGCAYYFFVSLKRTGTMFIQVMTAPLYVSDIVRGETSAIGSWLRQTIAIALTFFIQTLMFYLGAWYWGRGGNFIYCLIFWLGMSQAEKVLQKFGLSCGVTGVMSGASAMAQTGLTLMSKL